MIWPTAWSHKNGCNGEDALTCRAGLTRWTRDWLGLVLFRILRAVFSARSNTLAVGFATAPKIPLAAPCPYISSQSSSLGIVNKVWKKNVISPETRPGIPPSSNPFTGCSNTPVSPWKWRWTCAIYRWSTRLFNTCSSDAQTVDSFCCCLFSNSAMYSWSKASDATPWKEPTSNDKGQLMNAATMKWSGVFQPTPLQLHH